MTKPNIKGEKSLTSNLEQKHTLFFLALSLNGILN